MSIPEYRVVPSDFQLILKTTLALEILGTLDSGFAKVKIANSGMNSPCTAT